jgi:cytochrome P450
MGGVRQAEYDFKDAAGFGNMLRVAARRELTVTTGVDFDMSQVEALGQGLLGRLDAMRAVDPIYWSDVQRAWLITGNEEIIEGLRGNLPLSSGRFNKILSYIPESERWRIPTVSRIFPYFLVNIDPPEHTRVRKLLMQAFSRKIAELYRPFVQETIEGVLTEAGRRGEVEFVEDIARQIPGRVIMRVLGLPTDLYPELRRWSRAISSALGGGVPTTAMLDEVEMTFREMETLFLREIRRKQAAPGDDFISSIVTAADGQDRLSDDELLGTCFLTMSAGNNSTTNTLTLGTVALIRDPQVRAQILARPETMDQALMELMRYIAMSTNVVRMAMADFEWRGHRVKKGDLVNIVIAAANRDPRVFPLPDQFDLGHSQTKNMTFAPGLHACIGHFFARMQLNEFFPRLFRRFSNIELLEKDLRWSNALNFRGLKALPVRLHQ